MSDNHPEAGPPEVSHEASPSEAPAPQADSNPPPVENIPGAVDPATVPQPIQAASPAPQATRPTLLIPGQQPAAAAPAPVQPAPVQPAPVQPTPEPLAAPVTETTAPQPAATPQPAPAPAANPLVIPAAPPLQAAPAPQDVPVQPAAPAPIPQAAPIQPAAPAPIPQAAPIQPAAPAPIPQAAPIQPAAPAPIPQAAPVQPAAPAPIPQAAPVQPAAPQITIPLSGSPAAAAPPANPLLVAAPAAAPAPQAAAPLGAPPQPVAPLGALKPGGVGIGSVVPVQKKGMSGAVKGMIITTLVAALIVAGIILKGNSNKNDRIARLNEITSAFQDQDNIPDEIPLSEGDVQLLLDELTTAGTKDKMERPTFLMALTKGKATDGVDISAKVAAYAKDVDMEEARRQSLFDVVRLRGDESALPALIEFAKTTENTGSGQSALNAAKDMATASNFKSLLAIVTNSSNASIKNSAVGVLSKVVGDSDDPGAYAKGIVGTYNGTPGEDGRIALLRLMGAAGGDEAAGIITENLDGDNPKLKIAAINALRNWPDDTQFEALMDFASEEQDAGLRNQAFEGLVDFLKDGPEIDGDAKSLHWYDVASIATGEIEQRNVVGAMTSQNGDWADDVLDYFVELGDSDKVQQAAEKAKTSLAAHKTRSQRGGSSKKKPKNKPKKEEEEE